LFNSLSDQIYGHQDQHADIRARVIDYMRAHADYYKAFLDVQPGGGTRRNPKRKNAGAYSTPASLKPPTPEEIDRAFEQHVERMAKGGTWGDNLEIVAFAAAFNVDVRIYLSDFTYMVPGQGDEATRGIAHIAYHVREDASSNGNDHSLTSYRPTGSITHQYGTLTGLTTVCQTCNGRRSIQSKRVE
jgi:hypothetical protein